MGESFWSMGLSLASECAYGLTGNVATLFTPLWSTLLSLSRIGDPWTVIQPVAARCIAISRTNGSGD